MDKNPIELEGYDLTSANALTFWMSANVSSKLIDNGSFNRVLKDEEGNYIGETTKNYYAAYAPIIGEAKITAPVGLCDKAVLYVGDKRYETTGTVISATVPSYTDLNDVRLYIYDDPETENPIGGPTNNGASTYWIYNPDTKTLSISGEGTMCFLYENMYTEYLSAPYSSVDDVPWKEYRDEIEKVVIEPGVTSVGDWAFRNCDQLTNVYYTGEQESWSSIVMGESNELLMNANIKYNCKSYDYTSISDNTVDLTSDGENKYIAFIADSKGIITVNTTADKEIIAEISYSEGNVLTVEESEALLSAKLTEGNLYIISVKSSEISENTFDISISFEPDSPIEYAMGDVNLDGEVNVSDATLIQKYLVGSVSLSDHALSLADFNKDNYISIIDATLIQKFIAASGNN